MVTMGWFGARLPRSIARVSQFDRAVGRIAMRRCIVESFSGTRRRARERFEAPKLYPMVSRILLNDRASCSTTKISSDRFE
jgi:hypothetical protein